MKANAVRVLLLVFIMLVVNSCAIIVNRNKFVDFSNNKQMAYKSIRINGYYYYKYTANSGICNNERVIKPIMFYQDGTANTFGWSISGPSSYRQDENNPHKDNEKKLTLEYNTYEHAHKALYKVMHDFSGKTGKDLVGWGRYSINQDTIKIVYFDFSGGGDPVYRTLVEKTGIIKNDSTFIIKEGLVKGEIEEYRFREYSPKPDSLNVTMRKKVFKSKRWPPVYLRFLDIF